MRPTTRALLSTSAVLAALVVPAVARAQQQPHKLPEVSARPTRADLLDARAAEYEQSGRLRHFGKAARLREQAASLRAPEDPAAFTSLRMAANLRYGRGEYATARELMERAGEQALARGDVYNAAAAYVDVASLAAETRDPERVRTFVAKSTLLMRSPLLSPSQQGALQMRIGQLPAAALEVAAATRP
jgi:hypothetical protein